ncbi:hypothetical protein V8C86DRAFT_2700129 [Haematococcus lacustris]
MAQDYSVSDIALLGTLPSLRELLMSTCFQAGKLSQLPPGCLTQLVTLKLWWAFSSDLEPGELAGLLTGGALSPHCRLVLTSGPCVERPRHRPLLHQDCAALAAHPGGWVSQLTSRTVLCEMRGLILFYEKALGEGLRWALSPLLPSLTGLIISSPFPDVAADLLTAPWLATDMPCLQVLGAQCNDWAMLEVLLRSALSLVRRQKEVVAAAPPSPALELPLAQIPALLSQPRPSTLLPAPLPLPPPLQPPGMGSGLRWARREWPDSSSSSEAGAVPVAPGQDSNLGLAAAAAAAAAGTLAGERTAPGLVAAAGQGGVQGSAHGPSTSWRGSGGDGGVVVSGIAAGDQDGRGRSSVEDAGPSMGVSGPYMGSGTSETRASALSIPRFECHTSLTRGSGISAATSFDVSGEQVLLHSISLPSGREVGPASAQRSGGIVVATPVALQSQQAAHSPIPALAPTGLEPITDTTSTPRRAASLTQIVARCWGAATLAALTSQAGIDAFAALLQDLPPDDPLNIRLCIEEGGVAEAIAAERTLHAALKARGCDPDRVSLLFW